MLFLAAAMTMVVAAIGEDEDWPMWRYDAARTGTSRMPLPETLHLQWVRHLPAPDRAWPAQFDDLDKLEFDVSYSPVVMGDAVFVPSMVTDSVTAYRIADGTEIWRHTMDGPVRLAPAAWNGRVYVVSDDGHLYCLDARTGQRQWQYRAFPSKRLVLGNRRVVSMWAARGGPVVKDGTVYFAAGVWPFMGTSVHALDAETGAMIWKNTGESADWQRQPHGGAYSFAGIAPQGYLAATQTRLIVSGGRSTPALLDRQTGELLYLDVFGRGPGGYRVMADDEFFYNHGRKYSLEDGSPAGSGDDLRDEALASRVEALAEQLDGPVFEVLAARQRLFVTTTRGTLYCFGAMSPPRPQSTAVGMLRDVLRARRSEPRIHTYAPVPVDAAAISAADPRTETILSQFRGTGGHALLLGVGDGNLMRQLALHTDLHIMGIDPDEGKVAAMRRQLDEAGLYGTRVALLPARADELFYPPYISSLIVVENLAATGLRQEQVYELLRPYGGKAFIGNDVVLSRDGPLPGAGQWTHQYADAARTTLSHDERVRLPLGVLWYGTVSHNNVLPRHAVGPRPQVAGGRLVILGVETISARDVYTGRELWVREFPGIGHPFTNLELEEKWGEGKSVYMSNIPGAAYIGSPYVTLPDSIYLRHRGRVFRLDPENGTVLAEFPLYPPGAEIKPDDWGHVSVWEDLLITTTGPHVFDDTKLGWLDSWNATSSRHLHVMDRFSGKTLWSRTSDIGFRHNAIVAAAGRIFIIDGLSEKALEFLGRRGVEVAEKSRIAALDARQGHTLWEVQSKVFGTYLAYSEEHNVLLESGSRDTRRALPDEPSQVISRRGDNGEILWEGGLQFPAIIHGQRLIPARPRAILDLLTGERETTAHPITGEPIADRYAKSQGCGATNASTHLLLFRSGAAGFTDLEHDSGTGNIGGLKSGCTSSMIVADGILNAPDYTRTCGCSYQNQTSLGLIHMPEADLWTSIHIDRGNGPIRQVGVNLGAPGNRRADNGTLWVPFPSLGAPAPDLNVLINTVDFADTPVRIVGVSASTGDLPGTTLDGDPSTRWEVNCGRRGRFNSWVRYELSEPIMLDRVDVAWSGPEATQFRIETSLDDENWAVAVAEEGRGQDLGVYRFTPVRAGFVRIFFGEHSDTREDSRGRRLLRTASISQVRIGELAFPDAYAYFMPKRLYRKHAVEVDGNGNLDWVAASGVQGITELVIPSVDGGDEPYTVTLHFLEPDSVQAGERVFDIHIQGQTLATGVDILQQAGAPNRAISRSFPGVRIGPALRIGFASAKGSRLPPVLAGVEIVRH